MNKLNRNLIRHYRLKGMVIRFLISAMLVVPFVMAMSSCSGDEPVIDSALYGTWFASETTEANENGVNITTTLESTIVFNSQDKLLSETVTISEYKAPGGTSKETNRFRNLGSWYEVVDNTIKVNKVYNEYIMSYKIIGNNLILEYISGDKPTILLGKDRVVYTNKSKVDIVEYPYGAWSATMSMGNSQRKLYLYFFMDNELTFSEKNQYNSYLTQLEKYRYEFTGNKIEIYKEDNLSTKPDCILSYKVIGDNITLEYISGEKPLFISLFNSDKATYEIKK